MDRALDILTASHQMCSATRKTYRVFTVRYGGADYNWSLKLLEQSASGIPTKSGLMVGLGETNEEIIIDVRPLRRHGIDDANAGAIFAAKPPSPAGSTLR